MQKESAWERSLPTHLSEKERMIGLRVIMPRRVTAGLREFELPVMLPVDGNGYRGLMNLFVHTALSLMAPHLLPDLAVVMFKRCLKSTPQAFGEIRQMLLKANQASPNVAASLLADLLKMSWLTDEPREPTNTAQFFATWAALLALYLDKRGQWRTWHLVNWLSYELKK